MYKEPNARVKVNGVISNSFNIFKDTRQGDPLSPLIFALCIKPLAERIRLEQKINGIDIRGVNHKLSMYADDIIVYLSDPEQSIEALMKVTGEFGAISGYVLNVNKSEVMTMGGIISDVFKHKYAFHWDVERIKYLGFNITKNLDNLFANNFDELISQIKQDLNRWSIIPLSLWERVKIIQMNILPRFLFLFKALPIYIVSNIFKQWDYIIRKFIWNGRKPRIKMNYLKLSKEMGGLDLPNLQAYYQAAQVLLQIQKIVC